MEFDTIIQHANVLTGEPDATPRPLDIGIVGGRIEALENLTGATAPVIIDAGGRIAAPGFIDVHIHSEVAMLGGPHQHAGLLQGITTHFMAPDGFGWAPLTEPDARQLWDTLSFSVGHHLPRLAFPTPSSYLEIFEGRIPGNLVPQVPHCAVRLGVLGWDDRAPTADEQSELERRTAMWMEAGAKSLCVGLDYQPSAFSTTEELIGMAKVAKDYGGIYAAHLRYHQLGRRGAWEEILRIGEEAGIPVHVSHETVDDVTQPFVEDAVDLTLESYLYPASNTHLAMILPLWAQAGGAQGLRKRLGEWTFRYAVREHLDRHFDEVRKRGETIVFAATPTDRYVGMTFDDAAASEGLSAGEFGVKVLEEQHPYALMVYHRGINDYDWQEITQRTIQHPATMVASDGIYQGEHGHPRGYGCFPRILRSCVREHGYISLADAVYRMAGLPATRFGLKNRGFLRSGYAGDVVIFDPATVADQATWRRPRRPPIGISHVLVNGRIVVEGGRPTDALPGQVIT